LPEGEFVAAANQSASIIKLEEIPQFQRGDGVITTLLVGVDRAPDTVFTSGLTSFPPGRKAPMHSHNCGEQVTLLEGEGEVEVDGQVTRLSKYDTTYIPAGKPHRFNNTGTSALVILWIYGAQHVTRTFTETGTTVDHLSPGDTVNPK
jgi:quercetin dioxygenase-like cupin family protein